MERTWLPSAVVVLVCVALDVLAVPQPGDVFREYPWSGCVTNAGGACRVGTTKYAKTWNGESPKPIPHKIDLKDAIKAEVYTEFIACHAGTHGFELSINDGAWVPILPPDSVPNTSKDPWTGYHTHYYPTFSVPLSDFKQGDNVYRMKIAGGGGGAGAQNLIQGVMVRIYYDPARKAHATGRITKPVAGNTLGASVARLRTAEGVRTRRFLQP
jgi:hypothetical protein